jgi:hypothetical protein
MAVVCIGAVVVILLLAAATGGWGLVLFGCFWPLLGLGNLAYVIYAIVQTSKGKPLKYFLVADKFCAAEFAAAYPDQAAGQQPPAAAPPAEPPAAAPPA